MVRPSFKQLLIFAATIGPLAFGAIGVSWILREDLRFTTGVSVALGFACVIITCLFLVALSARTFIRAGSTGLEIADGIGRSVIPWAGIRELTVDTSHGLLRVGLVEGKDSTFEVPFLTGADAPAAADSLMRACDAFMSSGQGQGRRAGGRRPTP
jgi:hypothetical protein